jgi:hypothetical protein
MADPDPIFAITEADVRFALIDEQAALSPDDFDDACLYVTMTFEVRATKLIADAIADFLDERGL